MVTMRNLVLFLALLLVGLQGVSQQHYSFRMPYATVDVINIGATSFTTEENYYSNGCIANDIEFWFGTDNPPTQNGFNRDPLTAPSVMFRDSYSCSQNTTYYYYVKITNCLGTYSYPVQSFTSLSTGNVPTVTTTTATSITTNSASSGGNVTSNGGSTVTARGVYYGTSNHQIAGTTDGSGTGTFTSSLTGMFPSTMHYYRAYATNSYGTGLGEIKTLTTLTPDGDPAMTTKVASGITTNSATTGGNVQYDGGSPITERGVVYSTSPNPTTSSSKVTSGSGLGEFTIALSSLTPNTTYYYRAYAVNSTNETGYGGEFSFTTLSASQAPTVITADPYESREISGMWNFSSIIAGGNVTSDGGSPVTVRGYVFSNTDSSPTMGETGVYNQPVGSGTGVFSNERWGDIAGNTTRYIAAYAINANGTSYGAVKSIVTCSPPSQYNNNHQIAFAITINGVKTNFYNSLSAAQQACYDVLNPGDRTVSIAGLANATYISTTVLGVITPGDIPYRLSGGSCTYLNDGYYIEIHDSGVNHYIITVSGGVITGRVSCN